MCGSPRSFITSASIVCGRRIGRSARTPPRGSTGLRGGTTGWISKRTFAICTPGSRRGVSGDARSKGVHTEAGRAASAARGRRAGGQDPPAGGGRGAERRYTRRTFSVSRTGSGRGARSMMRWTRSPSGSTHKRVNLVLDADIRDCFGQLDQSWLGEVSRASDRGQKGPAADPEMARRGSHRGRGMVKDRGGTAQGASVSPLLANVFLHYVFDLWADQWRRRRRARGRDSRAVRRRLCGGLRAS